MIIIGGYFVFALHTWPPRVASWQGGPGTFIILRGVLMGACVQCTIQVRTAVWSLAVLAIFTYVSTFINANCVTSIGQVGFFFLFEPVFFFLMIHPCLSFKWFVEKQLGCVCFQLGSYSEDYFEKGVKKPFFLNLMKDLGAPRDIPHELYGFLWFQNKPSALVVEESTQSTCGEFILTEFSFWISSLMQLL